MKRLHLTLAALLAVLTGACLASGQWGVFASTESGWTWSYRNGSATLGSSSAGRNLSGAFMRKRGEQAVIYIGEMDPRYCIQPTGDIALTTEAGVFLELMVYSTGQNTVAAHMARILCKDFQAKALKP